MRSKDVWCMMYQYIDSRVGIMMRRVLGNGYGILYFRIQHSIRNPRHTAYQYSYYQNYDISVFPFHILWSQKYQFLL